MRIGIHGGLGSGKSLFATAIVKDEFDDGKKIISNMFFNQEYIKYRELDLNELQHLAITKNPFPEEQESNYKGLLLVCDEFYEIMDSRFRDSGATIVTYLLAQTRKRHVKFVHIEPKRSWADIRARALTDIAILCEKWHKKDNKKMCHNDECKLSHKFHYDIINLHTQTLSSKWINEPESIYPMYDTNSFTTSSRN